VEALFRQWPGEWVDGSNPNSPHEAKLLTLSIDKAAARLGWRPAWEFEETVSQTVAWYHRRHTVPDADMLAYSIGQIEAYATAATRKQLSWTQ
jgi:CDP-glucose 4,6-dehydratase